jgi:hypothetical protein
VAWERRGDGFYYYQTERDEDGRVRKKYVGTGEIAELVAHADQTMRRTRAERRERELREAEAELERLEALVAPVLEISEAAEVLVRAHLIACGCHRYRGEWRRRRGR